MSINEFFDAALTAAGVVRADLARQNRRELIGRLEALGLEVDERYLVDVDTEYSCLQYLYCDHWVRVSLDNGSLFIQTYAGQSLPCNWSDIRSTPWEFETLAELGQILKIGGVRQPPEVAS